MHHTFRLYLLATLYLTSISSRADCNQPSVGVTGGATAGSSMGSAKLGKKGLAAGLRPDPGVPRGLSDGGEEGLIPGDSCGGNFLASGEVGLFTEEEEDEDRDFLDCFWADLASFCSLVWNS